MLVKEETNQLRVFPNNGVSLIEERGSAIHRQIWNIDYMQEVGGRLADAQWNRRAGEMIEGSAISVKCSDIILSHQPRTLFSRGVLSFDPGRTKTRAKIILQSERTAVCQKRVSKKVTRPQSFCRRTCKLAEPV